MKKNNLFIFHGAFGSPNENWFPWLKTEVEKLGIEVFVPTFPTPEGQSLNSWNKAFEPYEKHLSEKSILAGHSLGTAFILNLLLNLQFLPYPVHSVQCCKPAYCRFGTLVLVCNSRCKSVKTSSGRKVI